MSDLSVAVACPTCAGRSQPDHPAGWLGGWHHTNTCPLRAAEDSRVNADRHMLIALYQDTRPATDTERVLLTALGFTLPTDTNGVPLPLPTTVTPVTMSVWLRRWPLLEAQVEESTA